MAANVYEGMFILDPNRYARNPGEISGQIPDMVTKCGGEMLVSRLWNEQKLAFPIKGHRKGTYWLTYFRLDGGKIGELTHQCRLNESVLRNLILRVDPRLVDTLVAHAKGETDASEDVTKTTKSAAESTAEAATADKPATTDEPATTDKPATAEKKNDQDGDKTDGD